MQALKERSRSGKMAHMLKRFLRDKSGATAIEYALIGTIISIAIISGMTGISDEVKTMLTSASDNFK